MTQAMRTAPTRAILIHEGIRDEHLSYYTLCKLSDATGYANPLSAAEHGKLRGTLTVDALGNFVSFREARS